MVLNAQRIGAAHARGARGVEELVGRGEVTVEVAPDKLVEVATALRDELGDLLFGQFSFRDLPYQIGQQG